MSATFTEYVTLSKQTCWKCGILYAMPDSFVTKRREDGETFYCPNGHATIFGEGEAARLRKELTAQKCETLRQEQMRRTVEAENVALIKSQQRLVKRIKHGVCPCCHRTVKQLAEHMKTKHPDYAKDSK